MNKKNLVELQSMLCSTLFQLQLHLKELDKKDHFCPISEAIQKHPELVKKYLGSVIPLSDHYFATLNSAVFTDGSFVYIPPNTEMSNGTIYIF